jgi:hypothetical protein
MHETPQQRRRIDAETTSTPHVPRDPEAYRVTNHFVNRLKQRVDDAWHPSLPATLIRDGSITRLKPDVKTGKNRHECDTTVAFSSTGPKQRVWTLVAGLRHEAYVHDDECHRAITIYLGTPISERVLDS